MAAVIAAAVNAQSKVGGVWPLDVATNEDGAGEKAFLRSLVARGLAEVKIVIFDDHQKLKSALASELPGAA